MRLTIILLWATQALWARPELTENDFIVHEWGTYTSVHGSTGTLQPGLHHGDEELPRFVHCPLGNQFSYSGCLDLFSPDPNSALAVNQRLETPVIYFHSKKARTAKVTVDFPQGVFSEWYPAADFFLPAAGNLTSVSKGVARWTTEILDHEVEIPSVHPQSVWAPSRNVEANYIRSNGENEKFIFYRGIGQFRTPLNTQAKGKSLTLHNGSPQRIAAAILLDVTEETGRFLELGSIGANDSLTIESVEAGTTLPLAEFFDQAGLVLQRYLEESGLYADESKAMVDTWRQSYFQTPGLRVLYIAPREWTDEILPIQVTPQPTELVRTLVGRMEILMPEEESYLYNRMLGTFDAGWYWVPPGRFAEPKLWRIYEMIPAGLEEFKSHVRQLIESR